MRVHVHVLIYDSKAGTTLLTFSLPLASASWTLGDLGVIPEVMACLLA